MLSVDESTSMLEEALSLWEQGFHVIPLGDPQSRPPAGLVERCGGLDEARQAWPKMPRIGWKAFQGREPLESEVREWWAKWPSANIGIVTGVQVVVIDADNAESVEWMESGAVTRTPWRVKTGKGKHFYYQISPSVEVRNSVNEARGLDVRAVGGYVVAPPSRHTTGAIYAWEHDEWGGGSVLDLPTLSGEDLQAIQGYTGRPGGELDIDMGQVKMAHDGAPVPPGGRNNALASMAGQWIHQGMSLQEIMTAAHAWNGQNPAPLPAGEVETTVASVTRTHIERHPDRPVPMAPVVPIRDGVQVQPPLVETFTWGEMEDAPPAKPEYFWRDHVLFRGAIMLLAGPPKAGKSRLFMSMGVEAAIGGQFLGDKFVRPLRVLWLQAEIHRAFLKERFDQAVGGLTADQRGLLRENFHMTGRLSVDLLNPIEYYAMQQAVARIDPDLICIDPIINFSAANENDNTETVAMLKRAVALKNVVRDEGAAIALLHHTSKKVPPDEPFGAIRGAGAYRGIYDTGMVLFGDEPRRLVFETRNGKAPPCVGVQFNADSAKWEAVPVDEEAAPEPGDDGYDPRVATVAEILKAEPQGLMSAAYVTRIKRLFGVSDRTAKGLLKLVKGYPGVISEPVGRHTKYYWESIS